MLSVPVLLPQMIKLSQQFVLEAIKVNRGRDFNMCFISWGWVTATVLAEICREWGFKVTQKRKLESSVRIWVAELTFRKSFIYRYLY